MISVLIVDDEPAVCRLLRHLIRWEELDMTLSGFVYDGQEALELLEEKKPDIVITDICMPGKSGLELIQESQCRGYDISYIIISGYREFKFAKQAISLGVEDYLLNRKSNSKKENRRSSADTECEETGEKYTAERNGAFAVSDK